MSEITIYDEEPKRLTIEQYAQIGKLRPAEELMESMRPNVQIWRTERRTRTSFVNFLDAQKKP